VALALKKLFRVITPLENCAGWFMLVDMRHTLTKPPSTLVEADSGPPFNVLIAYEDFETGKHAKWTYDYLAENLGRECQLTNQMWKFDALSIPKLREIAVRDAALADIIIISSHGDGIPDYVSKWIESWLMEGIEALALVALFDRPESQHDCSKLKTYLAGIAKRGGMEFFAQPDDWPGNDPFRAGFEQRGSVGVDRTLTSLAGVVHHDSPTPRWGINE
jgi:hypothetical protein